jgi:hypothetical protein
MLWFFLMQTGACSSQTAGRKRGKPVKYAKAILAGAEPDKSFAAVVLIDALGSDDLDTRTEAVDMLACLGADALVPLLKAWNDEDIELSRRIMVILGKMGPEASVAVPLLQATTTHPLLGKAATQALEQVRPRALKPLVTALQSPWTWSRVLDWLLFLVTHPLAALLSLASTVLSLVHWSWEMSATAGVPAGIPTTVSASFGLLGACVGGTLGAKLEGFAGAKSGAKLVGIGGSMVGLLIGTMVGAVVQPLVAALAGR